MRDQDLSAPTIQRDPDIPVMGTEDERAEAKQAEAKEEALKSLLSSTGDIRFFPCPRLPIAGMKATGQGPSCRYYNQTQRMNCSTSMPHSIRIIDTSEETLGLNYYGYPSDTEQYSATASYSTKVQRDIDLSYKNVGVGGGRYILAGRIAWFKNPFRRLFGIGNQTLESDEATYTSPEALVDLTAGIHLNEDLAFMWTEHYHNIRVDQGIVNALPQAKMRFAQLDGIEGAGIVGHKLTVRYDTRDKQLITTRGTYINISVELNQNLEHSEPNRWVRTTIDARHLFPHYNDRLVFVFPPLGRYGQRQAGSIL